MRRFCGRFAQARGTSAWARQFNVQATPFFSTSRPAGFGNVRLMASVNLARCLGEVPLSGFAEQYSAITQSFNMLGQSATSADSVTGEDQLAAPLSD